MTKQEIASQLALNHNQFIQLHSSLDENQFCKSNQGKWNPSQELDHIIRAVQPVVLAFSLPNFILRLFFGVANRPSRTYEGLIEKYHSKLANGGRASGRFIPKGISFALKTSSLKRLTALVDKLIYKMNQKSDQNLDRLILPHPLLGKLTLREMLYFTAYHVEHHRRNTIKNLELKELNEV